MTVTNQSLQHEFTVGAVDIEREVDTLINIVKRREEVIYRSAVSAASANIGFVGGSDVSSEENLSIADRSTSLAANRVRQENYTTISNSKTFDINTENFVVTDVFLEESETITPTPLFYKHILNEDRIPRDANGDLDTGVSLVEVHILDVFLQATKVRELQIDYTQGIIYNNLATGYTNSGDYTAYYVKYVVNNNGVVTTYIDLLDNVTVYRVAEFDDLTASMTIKTDGRKVYLIDEVFNGFTVTLPILNTYAFLPLSASRIEIVPPVSSGVSDSWFARVTNGVFFTNVHGSLRKYHIAEFLTQVFSPEPPIKVVNQEESTILSKTLIKLDHENIREDTVLDLHIQMMINDANGDGIAAFTTDTSIVGNIASNGQPWTEWSNSTRYGIKSIDHATGFIDIDGLPMSSTWEVISTYYYDEDKYEFTLINFNPISNRDVLKQKVSLFIDPDTVSTSKSQTLYYLKTDETGRVIESNWPTFDNVSGVMPGDLPLYYELYPSGWRPWESHVIFTDDYTVEGSGTGDFLVLGDITVAPAGRPSQLSKIDSRRRGGGIIDTEFEAAGQINPEVQWYWDEGYWDGTPYPGNASYYVEVPVDILDGAGGEFTQQEVRDVVDRHTAAGVYAVTKAYGADISLSGVYPGGNTITVEWQGYDY